MCYLHVTAEKSCAHLKEKHSLYIFSDFTIMDNSFLTGLPQ